MSRPLAALAMWVVLVESVALGACDEAAAPDAATSAWSAGPPLPRRVLAPGVGALGIQVAVVGGLDATASGLDATAEVDVFDTTVGSWGRLPDAPVRWSDGNVAAVGGTLFLAGGFERPGPTARGDLLALDPLDRSWRTLPAMPAGTERAAAGVVATQGAIYLLGGASSTGAVSGCLQYDIATQTWTALPELPSPRAHPAAMRRSDGSLIVAGGFAGLDQSDPRGEVWRLPPPDEVPRAWQAVAPMPVPRGGCVYGAVLGQLTCAGGAGDGSAEPPVETYDPYSDAWTMRDPMPVARANVQGAAVGSRLFVPGGSLAPGAPGAPGAATEPTDTLYIYAPLGVAPR